MGGKSGTLEICLFFFFPCCWWLQASTTLHSTFSSWKRKHRNYSDWLRTLADRILFISSISGPACLSHNGLWNQGLDWQTLWAENLPVEAQCDEKFLPSSFCWFGGPPVAGWRLSMGLQKHTSGGFANQKVSFVGMFSLILSFLNISLIIFQAHVWGNIGVHLFIHASIWHFFEIFYMTLSIQHNLYNSTSK